MLSGFPLGRMRCLPDSGQGVHPEIAQDAALHARFRGRILNLPAASSWSPTVPVCLDSVSYREEGNQCVQWFFVRNPKCVVEGGTRL
jgi:hypothetical protein